MDWKPTTEGITVSFVDVALKIPPRLVLLVLVKLSIFVSIQLEAQEIFIKNQSQSGVALGLSMD
jgi:hypothetical protein